MRAYTTTVLLGLLLLVVVSCDAPGPLKAERDDADLFGRAEADLVVVDAILIVDRPLPPIHLRRSVAPELTYDADATALSGAQVVLLQGENRFDYTEDRREPGRYLPPASAPAVAPSTTYDLQVSSGADEVRATTTTPAQVRIDRVVLLDRDFETEVRQLRLFDGTNEEQIYTSFDNQIEHTVGLLEVHLRVEPGQAPDSYQFGLNNLESSSPLLIDPDFADDEEVLSRTETSPLLRLENDALFIPWDGLFYAGRHRIQLFAVDRNWFDLVRTDNLGAERESGNAGEEFQRPVFHIEGGIGLFASASTDSFGVFIRPEGVPQCSGCECWGCGDRRSWSGVLDVNTGRGRLRFERDVGTGETCELSYEIRDAVPAEACETCSVGWTFHLGDLTIYHDSDACAVADGQDGTRFHLAQGEDLFSGEDGAPRFALHSRDAGIWRVVPDGWSLRLTLLQTEQWLFGWSQALE